MVENNKSEYVSNENLSFVVGYIYHITASSFALDAVESRLCSPTSEYRSPSQREDPSRVMDVNVNVICELK